MLQNFAEFVAVLVFISGLLCHLIVLMFHCIAKCICFV